MKITCTVNQQDLQNNSIAITLDVKIPVVVNIDPNVIVHYLQEKLRELCKIENENIPQTHSIQPLQATTCPFDIIDENINEEVYASVSELDDNENGPLLVRAFDEYINYRNSLFVDSDITNRFGISFPR